MTAIADNPPLTSQEAATLIVLKDASLDALWFCIRAH